jgi:hypothetical protein
MFCIRVHKIIINFNHIGFAAILATPVEVIVKELLSLILKYTAKALALKFCFNEFQFIYNKRTLILMFCKRFPSTNIVYFNAKKSTLHLRGMK